MNQDIHGKTRVRNDLFNPRDGFDRGRNYFTEAVWHLVKCVFFLSPLPWPSGLKSSLLRLFGAKIGKGVYLKPRVNIHFPWKLQIGDYSWVGEEVFLLNLEPIKIGNHVCISQRAFLCTGNHDYRDGTMKYRNHPIIIEDGAWIGAGVFVGPGVTVGIDAVVTAMSLVIHSLDGGSVYAGQPCRAVRRRWPSEHREDTKA